MRIMMARPAQPVLREKRLAVLSWIGLIAALLYWAANWGPLLLGHAGVGECADAVPARRIAAPGSSLPWPLTGGRFFLGPACVFPGTRRCSQQACRN